MEIKWLGAVLVIAGCGSVGFMMSWNYRRELRLLRQLHRGLQFMNCELQYRLSPLPELCRKTASQLSGALQLLFTNLANELERQVAPEALYCMNEALKKTTGIPESAVSILSELGSSLGGFDLEGQLTALGSAEAKCEWYISNLENNRIQRTRSYQTLGLCAGAALAILLM